MPSQTRLGCVGPLSAGPIPRSRQVEPASAGRPRSRRAPSQPLRRLRGLKDARERGRPRAAAKPALSPAGCKHRSQAAGKVLPMGNEHTHRSPTPHPARQRLCAARQTRVPDPRRRARTIRTARAEQRQHARPGHHPKCHPPALPATHRRPQSHRAENHKTHRCRTIRTSEKEVRGRCPGPRWPPQQAPEPTQGREPARHRRPERHHTTSMREPTARRLADSHQPTQTPCAHTAAPSLQSGDRSSP